jgi:hypothetical protein
MGFESENYSCCVDRAHFWGLVVKLYNQQQLEAISAIEEEHHNNNNNNDDDEDMFTINIGTQYCQL